MRWRQRTPKRVSRSPRFAHEKVTQLAVFFVVVFIAGFLVVIVSEVVREGYVKVCALHLVKIRIFQIMNIIYTIKRCLKGGVEGRRRIRRNIIQNSCDAEAFFAALFFGSSAF